jgi:hypothetical protein
MGYGMRRRFFLRDLGNKRIPFGILTAVETVHRMPTAIVRLGRSSMVAGAPHGGAPAPRTALAATV